MIDPAIDDPQGEWCYLSKSTTVIGVPYQPDAVQVTFDGAIYTQAAELCFFYGAPPQPLMARQKTFLDGWIPIVVYAWRDGPIAYDIEMFGAVLDGETEENTLQFVRARMRNASDEPAQVAFAAAMRHSGQDHRAGGSPFSFDWRYEMTEDAALRDGRLIYTFTPGARREAVPGAAYGGVFAGTEHQLVPRAETCLARYERRLAPGETAVCVFKMPRVPVPSQEQERIARIRTADYDAYRERTMRYWRDLFAKGATFEIPESRVADSARACMAQLMLANRQRDGQRFQTSGLLYPNFFMIDYVDMRMAYDAMGHPEFNRQTFEQIFQRQQEDGLFCDTSLSHGQRLWSSHGHMVHSLAHHFVMTQDKEYGREVYARVRRGVEWVRKARQEDAYGLMPPAWPYDAEMIKGRYTSHNLWSLLGLRSAIRLARALGEEADARTWLDLHDAYAKSILDAIQASSGDAGYVPTGLYEFATGNASREGFAEYQTNQDWENLLLVYPTEVLEPADPRVAATLEKMRREKYREGIMTYRNGQHLHQYLTTNVTNQYVELGEQERALTDLYHVLLHNGSTHEGFENMVEPWQTRDATQFVPPHAWAAAKTALLIRNMLVAERGGRAGLEADRRDLHLFSAISPAWALPGKRLAVGNAPTEMGRISAAMEFLDGGAAVQIESRFHTLPRAVVVHTPYFTRLLRYRTDAKESRREKDAIVLSPDATSLTLEWEVREEALDGAFEKLLMAYRSEPSIRIVDGEGVVTPGGAGIVLDSEKRPGPQRLSFELVREAYCHEYARRFEAFTESGGKSTSVEAPPLLTDKERETLFAQERSSKQ